MKKLLRFGKTTFGRMVILLGCIMVIVTAVELYAFDWSSRNLINNTMVSASLQVESYILLLRTNLDHIASMEYDLYNDEDLQKLSKASGIMLAYEKATAISRICKRLSSIKMASDLIEDARIFIPSQGITLHTYGYPSGNYSTLAAKELAQFAGDDAKRGMSVDGAEDQLVMSLRSPMRQGQAAYDFVIAIELSKSEIRWQYEAVVTYAQEPYILDLYDGKLLLGSMELGESAVTQNHAQAKDGMRTTQYGGQEYYTIDRSDPYGSIRAIQYLSQREVLLPLQPLRIINIIFLTLIFLLFSLYIIVGYKTIRRPIMRLAAAFRSVEGGMLSDRLNIRVNDDFAYLYSRYNQMLDELQRLICEVYDGKIMLQRAELKQLQSQINPHFLYNSYFLLHRIIKTQDYEKAVRLSREMGAYFQYITRNGADMVSLEIENEHAQIYAGIQAMRFDERISVEYMPLQNSLRSWTVPRLIIQPLIENAFGHGLSTKQAGGLLRVSFFEDEDHIGIAVEDNSDQIDVDRIVQLRGCLEKNDPQEEITAIVNIHRRIKGVFGEKSGLFLSISEMGGMKSEIVMQKHGWEGANDHV